jgi:hypothetical protein
LLKGRHGVNNSVHTDAIGKAEIAGAAEAASRDEENVVLHSLTDKFYIVRY